MGDFCDLRAFLEEKKTKSEYSQKVNNKSLCFISVLFYYFSVHFYRVIDSGHHFYSCGSFFRHNKTVKFAFGLWQCNKTGAIEGLGSK